MLILTPQLSEEEINGYNAPFPDIKYKAGVRRFPNIVPEKPNDPGAEISRNSRRFLEEKWKGDVFMAVGKNDPVLGIPMMNLIKNSIKTSPDPLIIEDGGHFLQEWGEIVAKKALEAFHLN
ncbi:unnamed protein product [marine sediment metagenome]|uniref:Haloalkane dehalogenase n=1 Tax=marine sediment metagenome TaxID=412755 RepID=X0ZM87_9ZZZZ